MKSVLKQYQVLGVPKEKIVVIHNGINLEEYAALPPAGTFKEKFGILDEEKIILFLGRIHKEKGIDILINAYEFLSNLKGTPLTRLVIVGPDDGFLNDIKSLTSKLGLNKSVLFTGPLYGHEKLAALVDAEVFVLPSRYETMPLSILEAYACRKPVICSDILGLNEVVVNNQTGSLVSPSNAEDLANKIVPFLNTDFSEKIGRQAYNHLKKHFTIQKTIDRIEDLYRTIVDN